MMISIFNMPRLFSPLKKHILIILGAKIGLKPTIYPRVWIAPVKGLKIGDYVDIALGVIITTNGEVIIGDRVLIGYCSQILSTNHQIPDRNGKIFYANHICKKIVIENDVWIGANCIILPGVKIGEGAVIGAGSFVNKDVEPWGIYVGSPAKKIGERPKLKEFKI